VTLGPFVGPPDKICHYYVSELRTKIIENREDLRYIFCAAVNLQRQKTILASSCIISRAVNVINYSGVTKLLSFALLQLGLPWPRRFFMQAFLCR